ncbi:MAG: hypothetical protein H7Z13_07570 [Ferruginibacter sp.]|nr:hypothetical protein [Ferruginibacter sp.]
MKNRSWAILTAILMTTPFISGCEVIGGIFKAGVWTGTIGVILILIIIIFIIAKLFSRKK